MQALCSSLPDMKLLSEYCLKAEESGKITKEQRYARSIETSWLNFV